MSLNKVQALLLEAASLVATLQAEPQSKPTPKPKPNAVEQFVAAECFHVPGHVISFPDFYVAFMDWLPAKDRPKWTKPKVIEALPLFCAFGRHNQNVRCIGNISFQNEPPTREAKPFIVRGDRLVRQ